MELEEEKSRNLFVYNNIMVNNLNLIIRNKDFGLEKVDFTENFRTRLASRGIVFDPKTKKIAMVVKTKINEYKLPGGGREGEETEEETFYREIFEETGCKVKIVEKLGTILEERENIDMKQISTIFVSELIEDTKELHPTKKEIDEGLTVEWMEVGAALEAVRNSFELVLGDDYEDLYNARFVLKRDLAILEYYIKH